MLDYFAVFSKGGALLWAFQLTALRGSPVDSLIRTCLLEERSGESSWTYVPPQGAGYTLKWTLHNVSLAPGPSRKHDALLASMVLVAACHLDDHKDAGSM